MPLSISCSKARRAQKKSLEDDSMDCLCTVVQCVTYCLQQVLCLPHISSTFCWFVHCLQEISTEILEQTRWLAAIIIGSSLSRRLSIRNLRKGEWVFKELRSNIIMTCELAQIRVLVLELIIPNSCLDGVAHLRSKERRAQFPGKRLFYSTWISNYGTSTFLQ